MTGRTHDLAAFTGLGIVIVTGHITHMSYATAIVAFGANMIGGLAPDIDQPTADLWNRLPAGSVFGRLITPFLGGHRFLSHSIVGILLFGFLAQWFLAVAKSVLLVDMTVVWNTFMIGYISHLIMDTFTKEGVPWLFPIPIHLGIPPFGFLRIKTGGLLEKSFVFPGLLFFNGYLLYTQYKVFIDFFRNYLK